MKNLLLIAIKSYKKVISPPISSIFPYYGCRFWPTCSEYSYEAIERFGVVKGLFMGVKRIIKCNPFSAGGVDTLTD